MSKQIFTRRQAVAVLHQINSGIQEVSLFHPVESNHKLFKLSNEELEIKLMQHLSEERVAGVVEEVETS